MFYTLLRVDCPVSGLGVEDTDVNSTTCEGFAGSVQIPAGRACYNGTTVGSIAEYACNCPSQYELDGDSTRVCQNDGTWTGTVPQCNPQCMLAALLQLYTTLLVIITGMSKRRA